MQNYEASLSETDELASAKQVGDQTPSLDNRAKDYLGTFELPSIEEYQQFKRVRIPILTKEIQEFMAHEAFSNFSIKEKAIATELMAHFRFAIELIESSAGQLNSEYNLAYSPIGFLDENAPPNIDAAQMFFAYFPGQDKYAVSIPMLLKWSKMIVENKVFCGNFAGTNRMFIVKPFDAELVGVEEADHRLFLKSNIGQISPDPESEHELSFFASDHEYHALQTKIAYLKKYYPQEQEIIRQLENTLQRTNEFIIRHHCCASVENIPENQPVAWMSLEDYQKYAPDKIAEIGKFASERAAQLGVLDDLSEEEIEIAELLLGSLLFGYFQTFIKAGIPYSVNLYEYCLITWETTYDDSSFMLSTSHEQKAIVINNAKLKIWIKDAVNVISQQDDDKKALKRQLARDKFELGGVKLAQFLIPQYRNLILNDTYESYDDWELEYRKRFKKHLLE